MKGTYWKLTVVVAAVFWLLGTAAHGAAQGTQVPFADPAFQRMWLRTDFLVANGGVSRSFYWGPTALSGPLSEAYAEGPNGKHLVQYFDKGRMEINSPGGDPLNPFYVTPGRLTMELVNGEIQVANDKYMINYPANIPIAGDTDDPTTPTYATFRSISPGVSQFSENKTGQLVIGVASKDRGFGENGGFASSGVRVAFFEPVTRRNVPNVFWDFLNSIGLIMANGRQVEGRLSDPYFYITGFPITDPWWVYAKVDGKRSTPVLVQLYERRVLTYVPDAPTGWKVQMGNIGQHYYDWRYKSAGQPDPVAGCAVSAAGSFGEMWRRDRVVQYRLNCARTIEKTVPMAIQHFEHGHMIYADLTGIVEDIYQPKRIYVLYEDGTFTYLPDLFQGENQPPVSPTPPAGQVAPTLGFGKVWRDKAEVRQKLGWGLSGERGVTQENYQFFAGGFMVRDSGKIYNMFEFYKIWSAIDDKYVP